MTAKTKYNSVTSDIFEMTYPQTIMMTSIETPAHISNNSFFLRSYLRAMND